MIYKIVLVLIFLLSACTTSKHPYLKDKDIELYSKNFIKKVDYLTNLKYGELIIRYDLLGIEKKHTCFLSPLFYKVFHPKHHNKDSYLRYLDSLEKKIEYKISSNSWLSVLYNNIDHILMHLKDIETAYNQNNINLKQNIDIFDILEQEISFKSIINQLEILNKYDLITNSIPVLPPIYNYVITSNFSLRKDPFTKKITKHLGIDLKSEDSASIYASAKGIVKWAGEKGGYGNLIIIDHQNLYSTRYAHLKKIYVQVGDQVKANQLIGIQGCTGRCTGEHLHYEIRKSREALNPKQFLEISKNCSAH